MSFFKSYFASLLAIITSGCLMFFLFFAGMFALVGVFADAATEFSMGKKEVVVDDNSLLQITLEGMMSEQPKEEMSGVIFGERQLSISLQEIVSAIRNAAKDERIKGIYLKTGVCDASYATLEEIRKELVDFRSTGKFVVSYSGDYTQGAYYLASVADEVCLNPFGMLDLKGVSSSSMFYKNLFDTLGVEMQVIKVGTYKSFTEQYTNDSMSAENREQVSHMVNTLWSSMKSEISKSKNLSEEEIDSLSTQMLAFQSAQKVLEAGLVDKLCYADEIVSILSNRLGVEESLLQSKLISVKDYVANMSTDVEEVLQSAVKPKIAVLYADGEIDNGGVSGITSSKIVKQLNEFRKDNNIFAVVLRVNSPGGSAYGAEQMWRAVERLKEKMPVIVSMGDYAASGGYYMSAGANRIFADEKTITGSIGVFSVIPNVKELTDKLGVSYEVVSTNDKDNTLTLLRPLSPEEKQVMQTHVNEVYETFLKRCMDGRKMSREAIEEVAEGRVWCGADALSIGLVDEIGTLQDAIEYAAKLTKVEDNYGVDYYPRPKNVWEQWMEITDASYEKIKEEKFPLQYHLEKKTEFLNKVRRVDRVQAILPYQIEPR